MKKIITVIYKFKSASTSFNTAHSTIVQSTEEAMNELNTFLGDKMEDVEIVDITEQCIRQGAL